MVHKNLPLNHDMGQYWYTQKWIFFNVIYEMDILTTISFTNLGKQKHFKIIIIFIKKDRQCKAERKWFTSYQSKDPSLHNTNQ